MLHHVVRSELTDTVHISIIVVHYMTMADEGPCLQVRVRACRLGSMLAG